MKTGDLDDGISKQNLVHNGHVAITNELRLAADEFQRSLKEAVKVNSTEPIQQLFQQEQAKIAAKFTTEELASFLPSFENMKTSLYRHRAQERPNLPTSSSVIELEEKHKVTIEKEPKRFLLYKDGLIIG